MKDALNVNIVSNFNKLKGIVVDLGCGERPFEKDILIYAERYVGVDWSNTLHKSKIDVLADLNAKLPFDNASFDGVVSFEVLEHLSEPQMMLSEAHRILKDNGIIILSIPFQWWIHEAPWDFQRYTKYGLEYQFQKAGFINIQIVETTGFWVLWVLKLNYQLLRLTKGSYLKRNFFRPLLMLFWYLNQKIAIFLDKKWSEKNETAGYVVSANKGHK
ncbi:methyltransferase domain-containing protein [Acinetobacter sp. YIM 103518]|uniref:Methyltransferase domain-containing protein n=2 Tax=Acinetobacter faecalis TaxID=2665161 RepID=A0A6L6GFE0_9GAMM|nr:methyltransferase domain-containing protein [Acinetobacter faecalis]